MGTSDETANPKSRGYAELAASFDFMPVLVQSMVRDQHTWAREHQKETQFGPMGNDKCHKLSHENIPFPTRMAKLIYYGDIALTRICPKHQEIIKIIIASTINQI